MRPVCADCGVKPPETNTNYTLISQTGWRLSRRKETDGAAVAEWRCSDCWAKHRTATKQAAAASSRAPGDAASKAPVRPASSPRGTGTGDP